MRRMNIPNGQKCLVVEWLWDERANPEVVCLNAGECEARVFRVKNCVTCGSACMWLPSGVSPSINFFCYIFSARIWYSGKPHQVMSPAINATFYCGFKKSAVTRFLNWQ